MKKLEIAKELLINTFNFSKTGNWRIKYEVKLIKDCMDTKCDIKNAEKVYEDTFRLCKVLELLEEKQFDMRGWMLRNSNEEGSFTFVNINTNDAFDICYWTLNDIDILYLDENFCQKKADNIEDAIEKYCMF